MKIFVLILYAWLGVGALEYLMIALSKQGRRRFNNSSFTYNLVFLVITIVAGPVTGIVGWTHAIRKIREQKKNTK